MSLYDLDPDLYGVPINTDADKDIEVYIALGDDDQVYVLHDKAFHKTLSWVEFDVKEQKIDFIMEDGDLRNFGISIDPQFNPYLQSMSTIAIAEVDQGNIKAGNMFQLLIHGS